MLGGWNELERAASNATVFPWDPAVGFGFGLGGTLSGENLAAILSYLSRERELLSSLAMLYHDVAAVDGKDLSVHPEKYQGRAVSLVYEFLPLIPKKRCLRCLGMDTRQIRGITNWVGGNISDLHMLTYLLTEL